MKLIAAIVVTALIMAGGKDCIGSGLIGSGFLDAKLYDINPSTGAATNPRNLGVAWALAFAPTGTLYGVAQYGGTPASNTLFTVNPTSGAATAIGPLTGTGITVEGDIAFDPTSGVLYAVDGGGALFTINTSNAVTTAIGIVTGSGDLSAMAFDASGNLYVVDTQQVKLMQVNKSTAVVISSVPLTPAPNGGVAGLSFDPCNGVLYLASGSGTTDNLYTVNPTSGAMTLIGPLSGTVDGLGALAQPATAADLYMKDTMAPDLPEDFGIEPTASQTLFISRDIWVRTSPDSVLGSTNPGADTTLPADSYYANEYQHQNPVYFGAGVSNYVYVKVRNRGCASSAGTEKLRGYWADASTGLPWPGAWNEINCVASGSGVNPCPLPAIGPGQDYVAELKWVPPDPAAFGGNHHFCLLARIETSQSAPFGMTTPEGPAIWQNVADNNNIIWKNVTVFTGIGKGKVIIRNTLDKPVIMELHFAVPSRQLKDHFLLHGDIFVDIGAALFSKWRLSGQRPKGFVVVGKTMIKVTDPLNAALGGLLFRPREEHTIEVQMKLKPGTRRRPGASFDWDITQMSSEGKKAKPRSVGGERYTLIVPKAK